ncbi:hypothetical protein [Streptomyces sulphureus]|uniref:hypothetical protein n=1 Tax=Streptomyces sulphureus TaxID=47758 RepID=UPI000476E25F|nr:hypothetical protein [Streptomyces sulphureus]
MSRTARGAAALFGSYLAGGNFPVALTLLVVAGLRMYAPYFALVSELAPAGVAGAAVALVNFLGARVPSPARTSSDGCAAPSWGTREGSVSWPSARSSPRR